MQFPKDTVPLLRQGLPKTDAAQNNSSLPSARLCFAPTVPHDPNRLGLHRLHYCRDCLGKQQEIDRLKEENARLKDRLRYQERNAREAPFGSSTPFGKLAVKAQHPGGQPKKKRRGQTGPCWQWPPPPQPTEITRTQRVPGPRCVRHVALASWPKVLSGAPSLTWCRPGRRSSFTNWSSATAPGVTGCSALRHPGCLPKDCWATGSGLCGPRNIMFRAPRWAVWRGNWDCTAAAYWGPCTTHCRGWNQSRTGWFRNARRAGQARG